MRSSAPAPPGSDGFFVLRIQRIWYSPTCLHIGQLTDCGCDSVFSVKNCRSSIVTHLSQRSPEQSSAWDPEARLNFPPTESFFPQRFPELSCPFCRTPWRSPPLHRTQFRGQAPYTLRG